MSTALLGARVKAAREAKRMSQRELATRVGTDQGHISRLEHGEKGVSTEVLAAIARELDLTVSDLIGEVQDTTSDYQTGHPAREILTEYSAPTGLRALAMDRPLVDALHVTPDEWRTLRSIELPSEISKDGYVQLLITVRAITPRPL